MAFQYNDETLKKKKEYENYKKEGGEKVEAAKNNILGKKSFTYDIDSDPLYKKYSEMYSDNAQKAMKNSLAENTALTGGYGNSYAAAASQEAYNDYMTKLDEVALSLRDRAKSDYDTETEDLYNQYNVLSEDYNANLDRLYNEWNDEYNNSYTAQYDTYKTGEDERRYNITADEEKREFDVTSEQNQQKIDNEKSYNDVTLSQNQQKIDNEKNYNAATLNQNQQKIDNEKSYDDATLAQKQSELSAKKSGVADYSEYITNAVSIYNQSDEQSTEDYLTGLVSGGKISEYDALSILSMAKKLGK